jgi:hypothetical protein
VKLSDEAEELRARLDSPAAVLAFDRIFKRVLDREQDAFALGLRAGIKKAGDFLVSDCARTKSKGMCCVECSIAATTVGKLLHEAETHSVLSDVQQPDATVAAGSQEGEPDPVCRKHNYPAGKCPKCPCKTCGREHYGTERIYHGPREPGDRRSRTSTTCLDGDCTADAGAAWSLCAGCLAREATITPSYQNRIKPPPSFTDGADAAAAECDLAARQWEANSETGIAMTAAWLAKRIRTNVRDQGAVEFSACAECGSRHGIGAQRRHYEGCPLSSPHSRPGKWSLG